MDKKQESDHPHGEWLAYIAKLVRSVEFGNIEIVIQNSKIVQINKIEKIRVDKEPTALYR